ncbi:MAG: DUF29 domain-containing protein [Okeania sp. SIO3B5]|nr:DUF29 family protein [Okeania sp. SIO3B5]NEO53004.1 DUF29 domain-containing protein [Okeania sp. SIO3B5]
MIQELEDLKNSILEQRYEDALTLIYELDGMSRQTKINAIESFVIRMLIHLIKNQLEQRLTNSWAASIRGSLIEIKKINLQENKKSYYIKQDQWQEILEEAIEVAIRDASIEVLDGAYTSFQLLNMVDRNKIMTIAENLLGLIYNYSKKELPKIVDDFLIELPGGEEWRQG